VTVNKPVAASLRVRLSPCLRSQADVGAIPGRGEVRKRGGLAPTIQELQAGGGESLRAVAAGLGGARLPAARGRKWSAVQVARLLESHADEKFDIPCSLF
jgi:hypothetical protein